MFDNLQNMHDMQLVYIFFVGAVLAILALLFLLRLVRGKSRRSESRPNLMMFSDIEKMKKEGLISDEEYRRIRGRAAEKELARAKEEDRVEREISEIEKVRLNPDLARDLLSEEELRRAATRKKELEALRQGKARETELPTPEFELGPVVQARRPTAATSPNPPVSPWSSTPPSNPAPPSSPQKMPTPGSAPAAPGNRMSELDILLEQGAISKADYMRLKKIIIKSDND